MQKTRDPYHIFMIISMNCQHWEESAVRNDEYLQVLTEFWNFPVSYTTTIEF